MTVLTHLPAVLTYATPLGANPRVTSFRAIRPRSADTMRLTILSAYGSVGRSRRWTLTLPYRPSEPICLTADAMLSALKIVSDVPELARARPPPWEDNGQQVFDVA